MQPPAKLMLGLLGRFSLHLEGDPANPIKFSSRKALGLIAYLALNPEGANRSTLASLLWDDSFDKQARQNLRQCLASLRTDLASVAPDLIATGVYALRLRGELLSIDAREFLALASSDDLAELDRAAALYRGEFLAGLAGRRTIAGTATAREPTSSTVDGWTIGGGFEYGFWQNWSVKAEYPSRGCTLNQKAHFHTVRIGLNYPFNWGPPVVVAKY